MDLEFDKEIDLLLRKEGRSRTITIGEFSTPHLDADQISAFASNSVPEHVRTTLIAHLAECENCRTSLAFVAALNEAEDHSPEKAVDIAVPAAHGIPWYRRLFVFPSLAYAMGGLVFVFAGFMLFSVLQYRGVSEMSQVRSVENTANYSEGAISPPASAAGNSAANTVANLYEGNSNASFANSASVPPKQDIEDQKLTANSDQRTRSDASPPPAPSRSTAEAAPKPAPEELSDSVAPPAKPMAASPPAISADAQKEKQKLETETKDVPKKSDNTRIGAIQKRSQTPTGRPLRNENAGTRTIRGRSFEYKNDGWYDSAYRGGTQTTVIRNSESYRKLDKDLRVIAESLNGTVVVVWKDKNYRIQ